MPIGVAAYRGVVVRTEAGAGDRQLRAVRAQEATGGGSALIPRVLNTRPVSWGLEKEQRSSSSLLLLLLLLWCGHVEGWIERVIDRPNKRPTLTFREGLHACVFLSVGLHLISLFCPNDSDNFDSTRFALPFPLPGSSSPDREEQDEKKLSEREGG